MATKIKRWGNSLAVRIPKAVIEKVNLSEQSEVEVESKKGTIIIFPIKRQLSLNDLLDQISPSNLHLEIDYKIEGKELLR